MRPIDADALSEKLCETTIFIKDGEAFQRMINDAPTIDAAQIVRCRDCKWQGRHWENGTVSCGSDLGMISAPDDGYCSFGERKEEDA